MSDHTRQQTFDLVCSSVIAQGVPSMGQFGDNCSACRYRTLREDGVVLKCGAGHLIPDERYSPLMEGVALLDAESSFFSEDERVGHTLLREAIQGHDWDLVRLLQLCHDNAAWDASKRVMCELRPFLDLFRERASALASELGLDAAVLNAKPE